MNKQRMFVYLKFTYINFIKSMSFKIVSILGVLFIVGMFNMDRILEIFIPSTDEPNIVFITDGIEGINGNLNNLEAINFKFYENKNPKEYIQKIENEADELSGVIYFNHQEEQMEFYYSNTMNAGDINKIKDELEAKMDVYRLQKLGLTDTDILEMGQDKVTYIEFSDIRIAKSQINLIMSVSLFVILLLYVTRIGEGIVEEKTNRITETLLSYSKPSEMIFGKLVGTFFAMITHMVLFVSVYLLSNFIFNGSYSIGISEIIDAKLLITFFVMVILGYVSYGFLYISNSSFADSIQDIGKATIIQNLVILFSFYITFILYFNFFEPLATILLFVPFVSIFICPIFVSMMSLSWSMTILVLVMQVIYTIIITAVCTKIFRIGIVKYGRRKTQKVHLDNGGN